MPDDLTKHFLEKSHAALKAAQDNIDCNNNETVINRSYYAIFYAVSALACKYNFATSKHSQLMGWFNKKFIYEESVFDDKMLKIYNDIFNYRQRSDYNAMYVPDTALVQDILSDAKLFVEKIETFIS